MGKPGTAVPGDRVLEARVPFRDGTVADVRSNTDVLTKFVHSDRMAHRYPNILIHCVFSTKERRDLIPPEMLPRLSKYFAGIGCNHGMPVLAAGGISNHSHLLIALPPDMSVAKAVQVLKANSSRWLREHGLDFAWQEGYGAFSVSSSNKDAVTGYIEHQAEHHQKRSYEGEFEAMLRKSGIAFDSKDAFG
jgi:putative transposase